MNNELDFRSVAVDLDSCPTVRRPPPPASFQPLKRTDFSELLRKLAGINTLSLVCSILCIVVDLIFSLIALGMGASNQLSCPIEARIPIYLIVSGCVNLVSLCFSVFACLMHHQGKDQTIGGFYAVACSAVLIILFQLFNFIWMIIGSVWIFKAFDAAQYDDNTQSTYCKASLYQYAVVMIILQYVLPFVLCCCKNIPFHF